MSDYDQILRALAEWRALAERIQRRNLRDRLWFEDQFRSLKDQHATILHQIDEVRTICNVIVIMLEEGTPEASRLNFAVGPVTNKQ